MTMKKLLGISLALVMLVGSVPLGFSEPLRVQLEQGIPTDQIQCDNPNHVLVLRTNGNVACVTERSAERTGWEIINQSEISNVSLLDDWFAQYSESLTFDYEFPLHGESNTIGGEPTPFYYGTHDLTISNLPKIGETADIVLTITNDRYDTLYPQYSDLNNGLYTSYSSLVISDNFEFVNQTNVISAYDDYWFGEDIEKLDPGESYTITKTIKAVTEGMGHISTDGYAVQISVHVGVDETLLKADYLKKYPQLQVMNIEPVREMCGDSYCEPEPLPQDQYVPTENSGTTTIRSITEIPEEEYRAFFKDIMKMTDEEVEEMVQKYYPNPDPDLSTQSFFFPSAFASSHEIQIYGIVTMSDLPISPTIQTAIHDVRVCVWEWDSVNRSFASPNCTYTNSGGGYVLSGITASSGDNTIDIIMTYSTNSEHSFVAGFTGQSTLDTTAYQIQDSQVNDITSNRQIDRVIQTDVGVENENNAFWIVDGIADVHDFILYNEGYDVDRVDVAWQFDDASGLFRSGNNHGGASYCPSDNSQTWNCVRTETLMLNGDSTVVPHPTIADRFLNDGLDDSNERWTIIHEYGHHIMNMVYGEVQLFTFACTAAHDVATDSAEGCAWSEGWSDVLPSLVDQAEEYPRNPAYNLNFETAERIDTDSTDNLNADAIFATVDANGNDIGQLVEGRVAAAIWDLYDAIDLTESANGGTDDREEGFEEILWTFMEEPDNMSEFYDAWEGNPAYPDLDNVMKLHYMDFIPTTPGNTAPVASFQTVTVEEDDDVTFWLYGTDADGDNLTFSITNYPDDGTLTTGFPLAELDQSKQYRYTPDLAFFGSDSFTFRVNDGTVNSSTATVSITVDEDTGGDNCDPDTDPTCELGGGGDPPVGAAPIVVIESVVTDASGESIILDASDSIGDDPLTFLWVQINNGAPIVNIFNDNSAIATFTVPYVLSEITTEFDFRVTVTDIDGSTNEDVQFDLTLTEAPPIVDSSPDDEDNEIRTNLFSEQFGNFVQWEETSEWDIESPEDPVSIDTNGQVAHIEVCDSECPMYISGSNVVELRGYDSAELSFWMWFGDDIDGSDSTEVDIATIEFRSLGNFENIETITVQDSEFERWFKTTISLNDYVGDEVSIQFSPMLQDRKSIIQIDAVQIDGIEIDDIGPVFSSASNINLISNSLGGLIVDYATPTATDANTGARVVICDIQSGIVFPIGDTLVTCTASDGVGNSNSVQFTITVTYEALDTTPPTITAPSNYSTEATALLTPLDSTSYGTATATDDADPNPVITNNAPDTFPLGDTTITWTATDSLGNTATATQIITVQDTTWPILTLNGAGAWPDKYVIYQNSTYDEHGATSIDNIDGDISDQIVIEYDLSGYDATAIDSSGSDISDEIVIEFDVLRYDITAIDSLGNEISDEIIIYLSVYDVDPQIILKYGSSGFNATAIDSLGNDISDQIVIDYGLLEDVTAGNDISDEIVIIIDVSAFNIIDTSQLGIHPVNYSVTDSSGNESIPVFRTVMVVDQDLPEDVPILSLRGPNPQEIPVGEPYFEYEAVALDRVEGDISEDVIIESSVDIQLAGTYAVTYDVTDSEGNVAETITRTVIVAADPVLELYCGEPESYYDKVIRGTGFSDTLKGTWGNDLIIGTDGNDILNGAQGNDCIYGGAGDDYIIGRQGNDVIYGGLGNDEIYGGTGNDIIVALEGTDIIADGHDGYDECHVKDDSIAIACELVSLPTIYDESLISPN